MRYEIIQGFEEILAGAGGKVQTAEEVESNVSGMGDALTSLFKVIRAIISELKAFLAGK